MSVPDLLNLLIMGNITTENRLARERGIPIWDDLQHYLLKLRIDMFVFTDGQIGGKGKPTQAEGLAGTNRGREMNTEENEGGEPDLRHLR